MSCREGCPVCGAYGGAPNQQAVARALGLPRSTVHDHLRRAGLLGTRAEAGEDMRAELIAYVEERFARLKGGEGVAVRTYAPAERVIRPERDNLVEDPEPSGHAILLTDLHAPFVHEAAFEAACRYAEDARPTLTANLGDGLDMHSISRHEKDSFLRLRDEVEMAAPHLARMESLPGRKVWLMGNHDERIERIGRDNPELSALESLDFAVVGRLGPDWSVYADQTHYRLGGAAGIILLHGNVKMAGRDAVSGKYVAHKMRMRLKSPCIFGHFHRDEASEQMIGYDGDPIWEGHALGWLGDARRAGGYVTKPEWTVGFGEVWWDESGFEVRHHIWKRGRFSISGRSYR